MHQSCHSVLVFLHLLNLGCRLSFASPSPLANAYFVMSFQLLGLLSVLRQPPLNPTMILLALHKHYHRQGLPLINGYDQPIQWCLLLESNHLDLTTMVLSGFWPTYHHGLSSISLSCKSTTVMFARFIDLLQIISNLADPPMYAMILPYHD